MLAPACGRCAFCSPAADPVTGLAAASTRRSSATVVTAHRATDVRPALERVEMTSGQVSGGVVDVGGGQDQMIEHLRDATGDR